MKEIEEFFTYLRFPSISAQPAHHGDVRTCAEWLRDWLITHGLESAEVRETAGLPVVLARSKFAKGRPTVLLYGHYDVQPVDPLELWRHAPFEPVIEDGLVVARGATDNKGQTFAHLLGIAEALLVEEGELPVNLILLLEGEEEIGSPSLGAFLEAHREELRADIALVSDTSMVAPGRPAITTGLRGIACLEVHVQGPARDVHSGMFGGAIANPAAVLARLLASLHDETGRIAVEGFYGDIADPTAEELRGWAELPYQEAEILAATGSAALAGERAVTVLERVWSRPTIEVNGLTSGYQGAGSKTIVPATASAKLSARLVPHQTPEAAAELIRRHLEAQPLEGCRLRVEYDHGGNPYLLSADSPWIAAAQGALAEVWPVPAALVREGLSIPVVEKFKSILGLDTLLIGLGLPDCLAHSPNETFPLAHLELGKRLNQCLLRRLASL
jgi:acetylornithine deacetylase/succinyl-diaminopimelate desuccinylase-like protein